MLDIIENAVLDECIAAPLVVQFLGVRSLVTYGATSTSNLIVMKNEIERRKAVIVKTEYDVAKLMAAQRQSNDLEMFINYIIETGDKRSAKEGITVTVSNPTRDNFLLAKQLVYNAMRLIMMRLVFSINVLIIVNDQVEGPLLLVQATMISGRK